MGDDRDPEIHQLARGKFVPNSDLPVLIYRRVLPQPWNAASAKQLCERNHWQKRGEWGVIKVAHFHPNTHECYAVFQGSSRLVLGRDRDDVDEVGTGWLEVDVGPGDIIVIPAGVSHRSLTSEGDYRYIGVYPEAAPKWRNNFCKGEESMTALETEIRAVDIPEHDPVYGQDGPLVAIWKHARSGLTAATRR